MADRKYYVLCEQNCKFESMTKEQILTAITQAVTSGKIRDVDTGFVTTIKTINGKPLRFFVGTQSEYEALTDKQNLFAIITNDTNKESIEAILEDLQKNVESNAEEISTLADDFAKHEKEYAQYKSGLADGSVVASQAERAKYATNDSDGYNISTTYAKYSYIEPLTSRIHVGQGTFLVFYSTKEYYAGNTIESGILGANSQNFGVLTEDGNLKIDKDVIVCGRIPMLSDIGYEYFYIVQAI